MPDNRDLAQRYPSLFRPVTWFGTTDVQFERLTAPPDTALIANINIVPYIGDKWLVLRMADGHWDIPGGTLEPGESYPECLRRELFEEAGANLLDYMPVGAWRCTCRAEKPFRPHTPHPIYYRYVVAGTVEIVSKPFNPDDGEHVSAVDVVPLSEVVMRFRHDGRDDLAELYQLAARLVDSRGERV
jgi:8-oxo-dGTP diphosphatase